MGALREQLRGRGVGAGGGGGVLPRHVEEALQVVRPAAARGAFDVYATGCEARGGEGGL